MSDSKIDNLLSDVDSYESEKSLEPLDFVNDEIDIKTFKELKTSTRVVKPKGFILLKKSRTGLRYTTQTFSPIRWNT
jgi:hypothetical protein